MSTEIATTEAQAPAGNPIRSKIDAFMGSLEKRQEQFGTLLTDTGISPAKFLEVARRAFAQNPELIQCDAGSLMKAFINAATDGLPPDGRKGAIVVYKRRDGTKEANWQPMVAGLLDLAHRSKLFLSIEARIVYEGDDFTYRLGDDPFIHHIPKARPSGFVPKIVNAYAVAKTTNGGVYREVFEAEDIRKVKAFSRATNGPWKDHEGEMIRKGPLRRLWKFLPKTPAMERIADHDDSNFDLDLTATDVTDQPRRSLKTGFQPKAIAHEPSVPFDAGAGDDDREFVAQDQDDEAVQSEGAGTASPDEGTGQVNGPSTEPAPEPLPPDYDIRAWAAGVADQLGEMADVARYDAWRNDPETVVRLDRLKEVDPGKFDALSAAAKARRLKLSRA